MRAKLHGMLLNAAIICAAPAAPLETPWGEPDLQGIWTAEFDTPLQRSARYADQEFFTEAQQVELARSGAQRSQTCVRSMELRPMSPALTIRWAYIGSTPGRERR
jgi:hypothetical protein